MKLSSSSLAFFTVLSSLSGRATAECCEGRRLSSWSLGRPSTPEEYEGELCPGGAAGKALYHLYVHVMANSHLTLVALKKEDHEDADHASCPDMAFHSGAGNANKEMIVLKKDLLKQEDMDKDSLHLLGEYTGTELLEAFEQVPKTNNEDDTVYDIVTHNCASFVLDMFCYLGYVPSTDLLTWTIQRLLIQEASDNVMDAISKSPHANDLPTVVATADDPQDASSLQGHVHQVVADLVYYYAANHQGTCFTNKHQQYATTTTTTDNNKNKYVIALVVENVVWFMIAAGCFWMGLRLHNKNNNNEPNNNKDEDHHDHTKMNNKNAVLA